MLKDKSLKQPTKKLPLKAITLEELKQVNGGVAFGPDGRVSDVCVGFGCGPGGGFSITEANAPAAEFGGQKM